MGRNHRPHRNRTNEKGLNDRHLPKEILFPGIPEIPAGDLRAKH